MIRQRLIEWADYFGAVALALWAATVILFFLGNQPRERLLLLAGLGVVFFILYLTTKFAAVRNIVTSRGARYGSNTLLMTVLFLGIVGLVNFLGIRYAYRYDTTANKKFTLSPLTIEALQGLKEPVNVLAFYSFSQSNPTSKQELDDRLKEYMHYTDKLNYKMIDLDAEPQIAIDYKVQYDGTIIFERGARRENVFQIDEQSLTNALLKVSSDKQPTLYFTTGHGERSLDDSSDNGLSSLKNGLELNNYKAVLLDLKTITETIPTDATALVVAGPVAAFDPAEIQHIKNYLATGGRLFLMLDPGVQTGFDDFLKAYGVTLRNDLVYDPKFGSFGRPQVPVINTYKSSPVTQNLTGQSTFFPGVRSMIADSSNISYTVTSLFSSSDASWGETDFDSIKNQTAKLDEGKDAKGPLDLGVTIEGRGDKPMRLVVIGNSAFLSNGNLRVRGMTSTGQEVTFGNGLLFLNAARWFAGQENLITIPPKPADSHPLTLTGEQMNFVMFSSFALLPGVILIIGALVWWGRR